MTKNMENYSLYFVRQRTKYFIASFYTFEKIQINSNFSADFLTLTGTFGQGREKKRNFGLKTQALQPAKNKKNIGQLKMYANYEEIILGI